MFFFPAASKSRSVQAASLPAFAAVGRPAHKKNIPTRDNQCVHGGLGRGNKDVKLLIYVNGVYKTTYNWGRTGKGK